MFTKLASLFAVAALVFTVGCGGDKEKAGEKASKGSGGGGGSGLATESQDLALGSLAITVNTPKGWTKSELGETSVVFTKPGGIMNSVMTVSATCQGSCDDIGKNLAGFAEMQAGMQKEMGYTVEVVSKSDDGSSLELSLDQDGDKTYQIFTHKFEDGWELAASCQISLIGDDVKKGADYKKLCDAMKAAPKK